MSGANGRADSTEVVRVERRGAVASVVLNDPPRNRLSMAMVDRLEEVIPELGSEREVRAVVKFFNDLRGYGFVTADNLDEDVFVHSRVLNDCGFHSLMQGQKLLVRVDNSTRGLQVNSVRLLSE